MYMQLRIRYEERRTNITVNNNEPTGFYGLYIYIFILYA